MNLKSFTVWKQAMLPDTPENLMQIIGIYKAYAVPMDSTTTYLYIAERVFRSVSFLQILHPKEYLDLHNHYAGDDADLRIWRGEATAHPELLEFMACKLLHHWLHRVNMEFAEECMRAMLWHGRDMGWGYLTPI